MAIYRHSKQGGAGVSAQKKNFPILSSQIFWPETQSGSGFAAILRLFLSPFGYYLECRKITTALYFREHGYCAEIQCRKGFAAMGPLGNAAKLYLREPRFFGPTPVLSLFRGLWQFAWA
jgi:hypothetical protein